MGKFNLINMPFVFQLPPYGRGRGEDNNYDICQSYLEVVWQGKGTR